MRCSVPVAAGTSYFAPMVNGFVLIVFMFTVNCLYMDITPNKPV
jgi:hypothetical protein